MTAAPIAPMAPFDLIIFGGTGDLALRKLLPALFHRYVDGQIVAGTRIFGLARDSQTDEAYRERVREALHKHLSFDLRAPAALEPFLQMLSYRRIDLQADGGEAQWLTQERPSGSFMRQLSLGDGLDISGIHASYENGVLTVTVPVAASAQPRKIEVQAEPRKEAISAG